MTAGQQQEVSESLITEARPILLSRRLQGHSGFILVRVLTTLSCSSILNQLVVLVAADGGGVRAAGGGTGIRDGPAAEGKGASGSAEGEDST